MHTPDKLQVHMPLLRIDVYKGRTDTELKMLLDAVHRAMATSFNVPERDRYQIVNEYAPTSMITEDTGLDIPRTEKFVFIQVTTRPRTRDEKQTFYRLTTEELERTCAIEPSDVMINCVTCDDEDWSFGYGRAQFLTGEL